ncbi:MAG: ABC transporter permease [Dissulfurispiraceae bacterium]
MVSIIGRLRKLYKLLPPLLLRDVKERYAGSIIGIFWTLLQPLLFVILYWVVFSQILKIRIKTDTGDIPFIAFLLSGLLPWLALQEGVLRGATSIVEKRHIIKKVLFPAELFPLTSVMSAFVQQGISIVAFLVGFFIWKGHVSLLQVVGIGALLFLQIIMTAGLSMIFSSLAVYLRDIIQVLTVGFQLVFYLSTILYPMTSVPKNLRLLILINPVTTLTEAYHSAILYGQCPEVTILIYLITLTTAVFFAGMYLFRKLKRGFADVL